MSDSSSSEWGKWASLLFDGSDGASRAVGDAWATWFKELSSDQSSSNVTDQWLRMAHKTSRQMAEFIKQAREFLNESDARGNQDVVAELTERIERLEMLLPPHLRTESQNPIPPSAETVSTSPKSTT